MRSTHSLGLGFILIYLLLLKKISLAERHISLSAAHSCSVVLDQSIVCVGDNTFSQSVTMSGPFQGVSVGDTFTCGLFANFSALCWGSLAGVCSAGRPALLVSGGSPALFLDLAAGTTHVCGLRSNGTVSCYGSSVVSSPPSVHVFQAISAGAGFSCGVLRNGTVFSWGNSSNAAVARAPPSGTGFVEVAAGATHACALLWNGTVVCWGDNSGGAVSPVAAGSFVWLSSGVNFTCGILSGDLGIVLCWGAAAPRSPSASVYGVEISCWSSAQCVSASKSGFTPVRTKVQRDAGFFSPMAPPDPSSGAVFFTAMFADGATIIAAYQNGLIWRSSDQGVSWKAATTTSQMWIGVSCSADGRRVAAIENSNIGYNSVYSGYLWVSFDGGVSFSFRVAQSWYFVAISSDGSTIYAIGGGGSLGYGSPSCIVSTSDETFKSWPASSQICIGDLWYSLSVSGDGTVAYAVARGILTKTTDKGSTWASISQFSYPNLNGGGSNAENGIGLYKYRQTECVLLLSPGLEERYLKSRWRQFVD